MPDPVTLIYVVLFFFGIFFLTIFLLLQFRNKKALFSSPQISDYPFVSFLVPAYNEENSIRSTAEALLKLDYPEDKKEIILLNDGSKDKTGEIAQELADKYESIICLNKKNSGKADSLNEGLKIARGNLVAVVDADSYPKSDSLKKMVGHFNDEKVAAVTSRVLVKNKNNLLSKFQVLDYSIIAWTRKLLDFVDSVYVTNGPLSIYRKSVIEEKGFDTKNLTEDIEITWFVLSKGYKTRMSYSAIVYTIVPEDLGTWIKQRVRWNLGGLQTLQKYRKEIFKHPENLFGYFVVPYVAASFFFAVLGFLLFARWFWIKGGFYFYSAYYSFQGYNPFKYLEFNISLTLLLFLGIMFFVLAIFYYKEGFKNSETGNVSVLKIISYSFFYRTLYIIPLLIAIYKLAKGDIRWYTK